MTDVRIDRPGPLPFAGLEADRWGLTTPGPGLRDLAAGEHWERSLHRSLRRRELAAARRPGLPQSATARLAAAVVAATAIVPAAEVASAATVTASAVDPLRSGSDGTRVRAVQAALGIPADGIFGPATKRAVRAFQRSHGLLVDGIVGPVTGGALGLGPAGTAESAAAGTRALTAHAKPPAVPDALARSVQRALGMSADGVFGPASRAALRSYQGAHGLTVDGVPGPQTLAALGLTGVSARSVPTAASGTTSAASTGAGASAAVAAARTKIGSAYASGGNGPSAFDCSGLTSWAMRQAGIDLPRTSYAQFGVGSAVSRGAVQAGDLVFFTTDGPGASHVGIATGPGSAISATSHGVMEHSTTSGYWGAHYLGARRVG